MSLWRRYSLRAMGGTDAANNRLPRLGLEDKRSADAALLVWRDGSGGLCEYDTATPDAARLGEATGRRKARARLR